jgi:8-oxo-dGTP pyrophosphatase MutT (NUDIX family)
VNGQWYRSDAPELQPSDRLADAVAAVESFTPTGPAQAEARRQVLDFTSEHDDALHRSCLTGHLTGSTWVVDHVGRRGLVLLHAKVGKWLQPGGHADGDGCLAAVALREATEETGIDGLEVWSEPIDIDVHLFVNRKGTEPDHLHLDVRYLVRAPEGAVEVGNHESEALRWIEPGELTSAEFDLDDSTQRVARHGFALAQRLDGSAP